MLPDAIRNTPEGSVDLAEYKEAQLIMLSSWLRLVGWAPEVATLFAQILFTMGYTSLPPLADTAYAQPTQIPIMCEQTVGLRLVTPAADQLPPGADFILAIDAHGQTVWHSFTQHIVSLAGAAARDVFVSSAAATAAGSPGIPDMSIHHAQDTILAALRLTDSIQQSLLQLLYGALCLAHGWRKAVAICGALTIVRTPRILQLSAKDKVLYILALIGDVVTIFFQFLLHVRQNFL